MSSAALVARWYQVQLFSTDTSARVFRALATALSTMVATIFALRVVGHVDQTVLLWPVSAVGLGLAVPCWHLGRQQRALTLASFLTGFLLACPVVGMPWSTSLLVGALSVTDVLIGASILSPKVKSFEDLRRQNNISRFLLAAITGPLVTAAAGALPLTAFLHQPWLDIAEMNFLAVSLGLTVVTPIVLLAQSRTALADIRARFGTHNAALAAASFAMVCGLVFWQNTYPFLFMVFPPLIFLLLITGLEGALFSAVVLTMIGWLGTTHGHGPILLMHGTELNHLKILQVFAFVCVVGALPVGALLDERKRAERDVKIALEQKSTLARELESSRHLFLSFAEHSPNVTYIKNAAGRYVYYNQQLATLFGIDRSAWLGKSDYDLFPASFADTFRANDLRVMNTGQTLEVIEKVHDPAGKLRSFKSIKFCYQDRDGKTLLAGVSIDMTDEVSKAEELTAMNQRLELLAATDSLSGLYNRRSFESRAAAQFLQAAAESQDLSMVVLDIDNFKRRNDRYGHAAGDEAIKVLGAVLNACARPGDCVARLGGEEFGILLPGTSAEETMQVAARIQSMLRLADHGPLPLTVSLGLATRRDGTQNWQALLADSDQAMYLAKHTGKDRYVHYNTFSPDAFLPART